jgi:putative transposase
VLAWCLLPNHFHLVVWTHHDGDLSRWMHWLQNTHVRRYHQHYHSSGHLWQGRFQAFPIQHDEHLLTVLRYVERNALRANLVSRAQDWRWSSLWRRSSQDAAAREILSEWPVAEPSDWVRRVNQAQSAAELEALRRSVVRGMPYGSEAWTQRVVRSLDLEFTVRPRGRPKKEEKDRAAARK